MRSLFPVLLVACTTSQSDDTSDASDSGDIDHCPLLEVGYEFELTQAVPYGEVDSTDPEVQFRHSMDVRIPIGAEGPLPAMVVIHGGGWRSGDSTNNTGMAEAYAHRGFATYAINYTLSTETTPSFPENIQDVLCAIRSLRNPALGHPVDPDRIVVVGTSAGGHLSALSALMDWPNNLEDPGDCPADYPAPEVQLAIDYFGPADLRLSGSSAEEDPAVMMIGQTLEEAPQLWALASPIFHVDADDPPLLIAHGTADGGQSTLVLVEGAGHGFHRVEEDNLEVRCVMDPLLREILDL